MKAIIDKDNVILIPIKDERVRSQIDPIRESLLTYPDIQRVAAVSNIPGGLMNNNPLSHDEQSLSVEASEVSVDYEYVETLGLDIIDGRNFSKEFITDSLSNFIVNETLVRRLNVSDPVNQRITWYDDDSTYRGKIIGVVRDFHYKSLHVNIAPLLLMVKPSEYNYLMVRIAPDNIPRTIKAIENEWKKFDDLFTFEYSFLAYEFDNQYRNEEKMGLIFRMMAILAVIIASLGLFGLSTFTVEQKTPEFGIRKVHGATALGILRKLYLDFSKWVLLAFLIAAPLAYWGIAYWLRDFSYRVNPSLWIFLAAFLGTGIIAILAVTYQAIRASMLKPVDSLRYE